ncbi:MAG: type I DNA topoisomerase [Acidimicrobiia bacterium]
MAKPLVIVESKAKAKTIEGFLGRDRYVVMASVGHVRDLPHGAKQVPKGVTDPKVRRLGIDVDDHFSPIYVVPDAKKHVVADLKAALKDASELYLATDEDREGEAISWHLLEVLKPKVPVKRMVFHEITADAISEAIENWRDLDMKLVEAQEGRRVLDRLVGYEVSNVAFRRIGPGTSAGRVQSVATRLVVDRERARMAFRAASYWDLEGLFLAASPGAPGALGGDDSAGSLPASPSASFTATLVQLDGRRPASGRDFDSSTGRLVERDDVQLLEEAGATALAARLQDRPFTVASVESRLTTERPKAPFITSTLQQEASRKLGFSAARTMHVAQGLYERGLITYMRTDSTTLAGQAISAARRQIAGMYGNEYLPAEPRQYRSKVKNAQEAHEAIRPAGDRMRTADDLGHELHGSDERRLYDLVWKRTIACQMADARIRRVTLRLAATSTAGEEAVFQATGRTIEFPGYLRAYVEGADDPEAELEDREALLPSLEEGDAVMCEELHASGHTTQPPARYTEASLVKELEERGIGRPSTYASVIDTIVNKRDYVWKKGNALVPSWTAFAKVQLLERYFTHLIDYEFTATMEEALDAIARGEGEAEKWLHSFYFGNGSAGLGELVGEEHLATIDKAEVNTVHLGVDDDGRQLVVHVWPNGANIERGDERAPIPFDLAPDELTPAVADELIARGSGGPRALGDDPDTGLTVLVLTGRFGPFVQLGEQAEGASRGKGAEKPKRASLLASMEPSTVTLDEALALLALPRVIGVAADGTEITAQNGRYGPYLKKGTDSRSLATEEQMFTVTLDEAEVLFAQPKQGRGRAAKPPLAELGAHPESGAPVRVLDGRFGPYVTDGTVNASVPRGVDVAQVTLDQAVELLRERTARGPAKKTAKRTTTKKSPARKSTVKKSTKRTTAKKATATKAAPKAAKKAT